MSDLKERNVSEHDLIGRILLLLFWEALLSIAYDNKRSTTLVKCD